MGYDFLFPVESISIFDDDRRVDIFDDRFESAWLEYMHGEWDVLETGGKIEFGEPNQLILTSPEGLVSQESYAFSGPALRGGSLLFMWDGMPGTPLPMFSEAPTVGLIGPALARWHSGYIIDFSSVHEAQSRSQEAFNDGRVLTLMRPGSEVATAENISKLSDHQGYLAYPCSVAVEVEIDGYHQYMYHICIANSDGTDARKLTHSGLLSPGYNVAVDGEGRVLFHCLTEISPTNLCVSEPDGGSVGALMIDIKHTYDLFDVNSDGDVVAVCGERGKKRDQQRYQICRFSLDGGEVDILSNDRDRRISTSNHFRPSINDEGEIAFRCLDKRARRESELCTIEPNGRLSELTEDPERPRYFNPVQIMGPDGLIVYACSAESNVGQLCSYNLNTGVTEELTFWQMLPYRQYDDVDINNHGQMVFTCWHGVSPQGEHLCGTKLGQSGYWEITSDLPDVYFEDPKIDDLGNIVAICRERFEQDDGRFKRGRTGLCRTDFWSSSFEWLELEEFFIGAQRDTFSNFDLSKK